MLEEVKSAADFLAHLGSARWNFSTKETFKQTLNDVLCSHYTDHWFPDKPFKGSAYRCMRIVSRRMDPLIAKAGARCGLSELDLLQSFPSELTMWVDPEEVSYRIGEDGSIGVLYDAINGNSDDINSLSSSPSSSTSSSPSSEVEARSSESPCAPVLHSCKDEVRQCFQSGPQEVSFDRYLAQFVTS